MAQAKQPESKQWVKDFNELRKVWGDKVICGTIEYVASTNK